MNLKRTGAVVGIAAAATMGLAACSDNNNSGGSGSSSSGSSAAGSSTAKSSSAPAGGKAAGVECGGKQNLKASGSSAQKNAMTVFANDFSTTCGGQKVDYNPSGSGAGINDFNGNQVDFAGSDSALKDDEAAKAQQRCGSEAWNLPVVFGPIAVGYNLKDAKDVAFSAETLAKIFNGQITKWNDDAIKKDNPGKELPDTDITVVYRSDESGTTDNFQKYLDKAAGPAWGKGAGKSFTGGTGEGAKGSDGVSAAVKKTEGTITYAEWSFVKQNNLQEASVITSAGPDAVKISPESVGKTIEGAKLKKEGSNDLQLDTSSFYKPAQAGSYPIVLATYEIVCSKYQDPETAKAVKAFLNTAISKESQGKLQDQGYSPIPDSFREKLSTAVKAVA